MTNVPKIPSLPISYGEAEKILARLDGPAGNWTVKDITSLTEVSGLDGESKPDWFIPVADRPVVTPPPSTAPAAPSGSPAS